MIKICKVEELRGNEIVARQILSEDMVILLEKGEVIHENHISRLKEFGIEEIYIQDESVTKAQEILILKEDTKEKIKNSIKKTIEKHNSGNPIILQKVVSIAETVIDNVLEIEEVREKLYEIKEHDADLYEHVTNVCSMSVMLAVFFDYSKNDLNDIAVGAIIHDIGLEDMDRFYVNCNIEESDDKELWDMYKKHPVYGYSKVENEGWLSDLAKNIVLYHHERSDGSGFPTKLKEVKSKIQIVQMCDVFDEMISGIGYEKKKVYEAVEYLKICRDTKFKGTIVDRFLNCIATYPIGSIVITNENEIGVVIRQNRQFPDRPVLKILKDKYGNIKERIVVKDLLQENTVFIEKQL